MVSYPRLIASSDENWWTTDQAWALLILYKPPFRSVIQSVRPFVCQSRFFGIFCVLRAVFASRLLPNHTLIMLSRIWYPLPPLPNPTLLMPVHVSGLVWSWICFALFIPSNLQFQYLNHTSTFLQYLILLTNSNHSPFTHSTIVWYM